MKKKLALVMACTLTASIGIGMFSGCEVGKDISAPGGEEDSQYQINWEADLSQPIEIKAVYPDSGINGFEAGNSDTAEIIKETTGYTVKYKELGGDEDNQINQMLFNKDQYHIMKLTSAQYTPYLEDGLFLDLTELLEKTESGKKLKELIGLMDYGWDAVTYTNAAGKTGIYAVPDFGYVSMEDSALVWNMDHLKEIGRTEAPKTLSDATHALEELQAKYGDTKGYHAFGIGGSNSARVTPFMGAFEMPLEFYIDDEGKVQLYIYDESCDDYVEYMAMLRSKEILAGTWQSDDASSLCKKFANGQVSCVYLSYWWIKSLISAIIDQDPNLRSTDYQKVHDEKLAWETRLRADSYSFTDSQGNTRTSPEHARAKTHGGDSGVSYYTVIPYYMAEYALHIIDFLAKKLENFAEYYGGREGVHWNKVDAPEGAPAEYDPSNPYCMKDWEDYTKKIIYMNPYSYQYQNKTVSGGGYWIQLTDRYMAQIVDNSQYCNGTNKIEAATLFHLRETGFDAWQVTTVMDETIITNPMTMSPPFKYWSPVNILSRTDALYGIANAMSSKTPVDSLNLTRAALKKNKTKRNGVTYYYWSEDISNEMTKWYTEVKLNRK